MAGEAPPCPSGSALFLTTQGPPERDSLVDANIQHKRPARERLVLVSFQGKKTEGDCMLTKMKSLLKKSLPAPAYNILRALRNVSDLFACISFLRNQSLNVSLRDRIWLLKQFYLISFSVDSPHTQAEILACVQSILSLPRNSKGVVVEAGCYKGSSTAKFSLAADIVGKELVVFDSFRGIPANDEPHERNIFGKPAGFTQGSYCGALDEVEANVAKYGRIDRCRFVQGWFQDTLPEFKELISAVYLDVDLASSTRTCLKYFYPLLESGGVLYSHDGHLPLVIDVFHDDNFWTSEVGCNRPQVVGLGEKKLIKITREAS